MVRSRWSLSFVKKLTMFEVSSPEWQETYFSDSFVAFCSYYLIESKETGGQTL